MSLGLLTTLVISVVLGLLITGAGVQNAVALTIPNFAAVVAGGFVAGWTAQRTGAIHGAIVAALYLVISGGFNLAAELGLIGGGPPLLPRMNMGGLLVADVVLLLGSACAGALGHNLAPRRAEREAGSRRDPL